MLHIYLSQYESNCKGNPSKIKDTNHKSSQPVKRCRLFWKLSNAYIKEDSASPKGHIETITEVGSSNKKESCTIVKEQQKGRKKNRIVLGLFRDILSTHMICNKGTLLG